MVLGIEPNFARKEIKGLVDHCSNRKLDGSHFLKAGFIDVFDCFLIYF